MSSDPGTSKLAILQPNPKTQIPPALAGSGLKQALGQAQRQRIAESSRTPPSVEGLLTRLERVRKAGAGWTALCPSHKDRTASLSIAVGIEGRLLLRCFAGCSIGDILSSIGMTVADLFPRRLTDSPEQRRELGALSLRADLRAASSVLDFESNLILIAAESIRREDSLADSDIDRLAVACDRIRAARLALGGAR